MNTSVIKIILDFFKVFTDVYYDLIWRNIFLNDIIQYKDSKTSMKKGLPENSLRKSI